MMLVEHLDRPLPHRPATRPQQQIDQRVAGCLPQRGVCRCRRQLSEGVSPGERPTVGFCDQGRAIVKEDVHHTPVVEQREPIGNIVVGVLHQGFDRARLIACRLLHAELAEIAPAAPPQVIARVDREEPQRRAACLRAMEMGIPQPFVRPRHGRRARHADRFGDPAFARGAVVIPAPLANAAHGAVERHEEAGHDHVVAGLLGGLEQPFDQRLVTIGVEGQIEVGQQQPPGFGPGICEPSWRQAAEEIGLVDMAQLVHEGGVAAIEHLLGGDPGACAIGVVPPGHRRLGSRTRAVIALNNVMCGRPAVKHRSENQSSNMNGLTPARMVMSCS